MFAVSHMVVGGAIGKRIKYPYLALPVAFLSHFVLDGIPHVDLGSIYLGTSQPPGVIVLNGVMLVVILALFLRVPGNRRLAVPGMLAAILPDCLAMFGRAFPPAAQWSWMRGLMWLHTVHHPSLPWSGWPLGLSTQVATIGLAFLVIRGGVAEKTGSATT